MTITNRTRSTRTVTRPNTRRRWLLIVAVVVSVVVGGSVLILAPLGGLDDGGRAHAIPEPRRVTDGEGAPVLRVMPLGDSITHGLQYPGGYRERLSQLAGDAGTSINFVGSQRNGGDTVSDPDHEGHPGWQIQQLDHNVSTLLRIYRPDVILLHIGSNNFWQQGELPDLAPARLARLIDRITATAPDAALYVATIVPSGRNDARVQQFNAAIPAMVSQRAELGANVTLVDQHAALTAADLIDGIHPNQQGYTKMADCWWRAMAPRL